MNSRGCLAADGGFGCFLSTHIVQWEQKGFLKILSLCLLCNHTLPWAEKTSARQRLHLHYAKGKDVTTFSFIQDVLEIL